VTALLGLAIAFLQFGGGAPPASAASLGLVIGTNVQAYDADLTTYAGITPSANVQTMLGSANNAAIVSNIGAQPSDSDLTNIAAVSTQAFGRGLLAETNASSLRTTAELSSSSDVSFDDLTVSTIIGNGRASLYGGITYNTNPISGTPYTVAASDIWIFCDPAGGNITINLPTPGGSAAGYAGATVCAAKSTANANKCTLDTPGAETISGAASVDLDVNYEFYCVTSTGSNWLVTNKGTGP